MRLLPVALMLLTLVLAGCAEPNDAQLPQTTTGPAEPCGNLDVPAPSVEWKAETPRVSIETNVGSFEGTLERERAPNTTTNFLTLAREGFYDGVTFHRVVKGFVIQGGDGSTRDVAPASANFKIPDEFNPTLRHDAEGVFSMATAGPDTGSSQFFVTLAPTPSLDDRHAVFGRVSAGMDVVKAIGNAPVRGESPVETIRIQSVREIEPAAFDASHAIGLHPVIPAKLTEPGHAVTFAVVLKNLGNTRDAIALTALAPEGWTCSVAPAAVISAGTARVMFITLIPPQTDAQSVTIPLHAESAWGGSADGTVTVNFGKLGAPVKMGDKVTANYAGVLPDGRLFDTSFEVVAKDPAMPKFTTQGGFNARPAYSTFPFTVGSGVIQGFTDLALTARAGETVTMPIPAAKAYATGDMYQRPLTGRDLVFELEIVKVG